MNMNLYWYNMNRWRAGSAPRAGRSLLDQCSLGKVLDAENRGHVSMDRVDSVERASLCDIQLYLLSGPERPIIFSNIIL